MIIRNTSKVQLQFLFLLFLLWPKIHSPWPNSVFSQIEPCMYQILAPPHYWVLLCSKVGALMESLCRIRVRIGLHSNGNRLLVQEAED
ncbi:unnamed protein product [Trifolium pratense]|uniref:Uncharacterized protein n=1 Tax=Trifolium pratense TaxID=57577 RepID=A0ACB0JCW4_TRIPR|nr:unnamed protein product [Trifolium pratense]